VRAGFEVSAVTQGPDAVDLGIRNASGDVETVRARWVVGADGAYSTVRRAAQGGVPDRLPGMHGVRRYVDAPASDLLSVYFPAELLPGYGWIFPMPGGGVNVGIGVQRSEDDCGTICREELSRAKGRFALGGLGRMFREFLGRPEVVSRIGEVGPDSEDARVRAWPIPSDPDLTFVGSGRCLLVGDAARLVDPMTGEGIGQALISSRLAARVIATGDTSDAAARYRRALDLELGRDLRFARWMLRIMKRRRGVEWGFKVAAFNDWTRRNVARWMYEDYPRAYLGTPDRWGRHSMRGRGAYQA
jgi:flavin-dependent dehydrogenase